MLETGGAGLRGGQHWARLQLMGGGERVFPKTTFLLESLANLGPQSCGDTRRGRTRRPSKAVSQQATVEAAGVPRAPRQQLAFGDRLVDVICRVWT